MSKLSEADIDNLVVAEAEIEEAWEKPIAVSRERQFIVRLGRPVDIDSRKDVLEGTPVFRGTQVPIAALLEDLENGISIDGFIDKFPSVKREQAVSILEMLKRSLSQLKAV